MKRILVTNDDGIKSEGLAALAKTLRPLGEIWVVAPDREMSAVSRSLTLHRPLRVESMGPLKFAVDGTPTDCINLACHCILPQRPDLIVSGINIGGNLGDDISYSGTVSAAFEGTMLQIPSFAVSLATRDDDKESLHFLGAARFARRVAKYLLKCGLPPNTLLNINAPNIKESEILGHKITRQGRRRYGEEIIEKIDPRGKKYYWIGINNNGYDEIEDSDLVAISKNLISITPLHTDFTDYSFYPQLLEWRL